MMVVSVVYGSLYSGYVCGSFSRDSFKCVSRVNNGGSSNVNSEVVIGFSCDSRRSGSRGGRVITLGGRKPSAIVRLFFSYQAIELLSDSSLNHLIA